MVTVAFPNADASSTARTAQARQSARPLVVLAALALLASAAHAEDSPETARLRDALRQTSAKLQETESQLEQAQLAVAAAEHARDELKQQAPVAKKDDARTAALQRQVADAARQLAQAREDGQKAQAAQQASEQLAQGREAERSALAAQLAQLRARMEHCAAGDEELYRTGMEIVAIYRDPDFANRLHDFHLKPFGFARVKQENRMRTLEDHFAEQHAKVEGCRSETVAVAPARSSGTQSAASVAPTPQGTP